MMSENILLRKVYIEGIFEENSSTESNTQGSLEDGPAFY